MRPEAGMASTESQNRTPRSLALQISDHDAGHDHAAEVFVLDRAPSGMLPPDGQESGPTPAWDRAGDRMSGRSGRLRRIRHQARGLADTCPIAEVARRF